jgi:hypothetical protein
MQKLRLLKQYVQKGNPMLQRLMRTSNKPVIEITKLFSSHIYICLTAPCLKVAYIYNLKFSVLAECSLLITHAIFTYLF